MVSAPGCGARVLVGLLATKRRGPARTNQYTITRPWGKGEAFGRIPNWIFVRPELSRQARYLYCDLVRRKSGRQNVLFLIDEAGQYVAPRGDLILNLDGLARNVKELGQGRAWIVATGQQTLTRSSNGQPTIQPSSTSYATASPYPSSWTPATSGRSPGSAS